MKSLARSLKPVALAISFGALSATLAASAFAVAPPTIPIYQAPLFLTSPVLPNVLVIYDNSQSMDAYMNGQLVSGNDVNTRGNIGRDVMRTTITNYRTAFRWGLMSFGLSGASLNNTYAYFLGESTTPTMYFTDNCFVAPSKTVIDALTPGTTISGTARGTGGALGCVPNPQPFTGGNYVTFGLSGDDPTINDVLYTTGAYTRLWGLTAGGTDYAIYTSHNTVNAWAAGDFTGGLGTWSFTPTDAGYLPSAPSTTRQLYLPRGWGYYSNISGSGTLNEAVEADSVTHFNDLIGLLGNETNTATGEIKNAAVFTPLKGTLDSAKTYFAGGTSPIQYSCQKSFVMLVTDGLPTGKTDGTQYPYSQFQPIATFGGGAWTYNTAAQDVISSVTALRSTTKSGNTYDIETYVVALGDGVGANSAAVATMNEMARVGGTTSAYFASNKTAFQTAIQGIVSDISGKTGAGASVALNTGTWTTGSALFQAKFNIGANSSDWYGQLLSYAIDIDGVIAGTPTWNGGTQINAQNYDTGRNIVTIKSNNTGIPFRWPVDPLNPTTTELDAAQVTALNTGSLGGARLNYLRGSTTDEGTGNNFRTRPESKLGDIVNSAPYYVAAPAFNYSDSFESAPYSTFYSTYSGRTPMVYVGANDGMLHGFNATTGDEKLAFVPSAVFSALPQLTLTNYAHRWYVDGSPTVGDAFFGGAWHTMLVGGLRGGGRSIYALDVTNPGIFTESNASSIVKWEFDVSKDTTAADPDADATAQYALGYTFSQPSIVKMNNGKWVAVFGSGYDNAEPGTYQNANGYAVLYILDISNGSILKKINTKVGSCTVNGSTINNGLSTPTPVDTSGDGIVDYIYAGDLCGNIWNFDVTGSNPSSWDIKYKSGLTPQPLWTAVDGSGNVQPIMVRPEVTKLPTSVGGVLVLFGTGLYLQASDIASTAQQSFYGIRDPLPNNSNQPNISRTNLLAQSVVSTFTAGGNTYRVTTDTLTGSTTTPPGINYSTKTGWRFDFPAPPLGFGAERQITDPVLSNGKIIFTTGLPNSQACSGGGDSWLMELDALSGSMLTTQVFDTNGDGYINAADQITGGRKISNNLASAPGILGGAGGSSSSKLENKYLNLSGGSIEKVLEKAGGLGSGRVSWRELQQ